MRVWFGKTASETFNLVGVSAALLLRMRNEESMNLFLWQPVTWRPLVSSPQPATYRSYAYPRGFLEKYAMRPTEVSGFLFSLTSNSSLKPAAAAKSLQLCLTLCDPIDGSPPGSAIPGILQAKTLEWVAISFSNAWKWKVNVKSLNCVRLLATPWTAAHQAPPSMGFFQARVLEWGASAFSYLWSLEMSFLTNHLPESWRGMHYLVGNPGGSNKNGS